MSLSTDCAVLQFFDSLQTFPPGVKVAFQTVIADFRIKPSWYQARQWMASSQFRPLQPAINVMVCYNNDKGASSDIDTRETDLVDTKIELVWCPDQDYLNHELFLLGADYSGNGVTASPDDECCDDD